VTSILKILGLTIVLVLSGCALCYPPVEQDNDYYLPDIERNLVPQGVKPISIGLEATFALPIVLPQNRIVIVPHYMQPIRSRHFPVMPWISYCTSEHRPSYGLDILLIKF
jgi:hypothetical protein